MLLVNLGKSTHLNSPHRKTDITYNDQRPLIRRIERHLKDLRMLLVVRIIVLNIPPSKARETRLRSVAEDLALRKGHVRLVELDARVERRNVRHLAHARACRW